MKHYRILQTACALSAALLLLAACSQDDTAADDNALPEGKYPMTFTAAMDGLTATRATTDNKWKGSEEVAVQVGEIVKKYEVASNGNLSSDAPFYWQNTNSISVTAWYLGTGYNATSPHGASWAVQPDQSKTEPGNADDNYQRSDFLYAPAQSIAFKPQAGADNSLTFYHQTAKVVVNIVNAEAATDAGQIKSVIIGHNNLALKGTYTAPGTGQTAGTWTLADSDMGTIIAKKLTTAGTLAGGTTTALASYAALVIPQDMKDEKFIAITLSDNNTYYYTPKNAEANLQSGQQHTYDITVKYGYLEVGVSTSSQWSGGSEEVTGTAQTVTPGTDGNGSDWTQDGNAEDVSGTERQ